jgi:hypothetical protein
MTSSSGRNSSLSDVSAQASGLLPTVQVANAGCPVRWLNHFRRHAVWDYSARNVKRWARLGVRDVRHLPVGYVPQLSRIPRDEENIDVLFYGSVNERRQEILTALR